jgi:RNA polymerase sigma-70 factor (ECF subfamily)
MADDLGISTSPTLLRELANPATREAAWRTFLERYQPLIQRWARSRGLNHEEADDISAVVLAKLVEVMASFHYDPTKRFRSWLRTVVDNEVCSFWRQAARRPCAQGSGDPAVQQFLEQIPSREDLDALVETLDEAVQNDLRLAREIEMRVRKRVQERTWQAFWLTAMENQPAKAVAQQLGMTVAAVYMAKHRVDRLLRTEGARLRGRADGRKERDA